MDTKDTALNDIELCRDGPRKTGLVAIKIKSGSIEINGVTVYLRDDTLVYGNEISLGLLLQAGVRLERC